MKQLKYFVFLALLLVVNFLSLSQTTGKGSGYAKLLAPFAKLGNDNLFDSPRVKPLKRMPKSDSEKIRPGDAAAVGGLAFKKIAKPGYDLQVQSLELNYMQGNEDGYRFQIVINGQLIESVLDDWQAIPIANFANSEYHACFTAFGKFEKEDTALVNFINGKGGKILNYHPAFENSLLGLRLMQTDILLMSNNSAELPKNIKEKYILGNREIKPDVGKNQRGFQNLYYHLMMCQNTCNVSYRSYIICDYKQDIKFDIVDNKLKFSGNPYYFCWKYKMDLPEFNADSVSKAILSYIQTTLDTLPKNIDIQQNWIIAELLPELKHYKNEHYNNGMDKFYDQIFQFSNQKEQKSLLKRYDIQSLANLLLSTRRTNVLRELVYLECFSDKLSSNPDYFYNTNPAIWTAVQNTMWYSAFFRYCKENYPNVWGKFTNKIKDVKLEPKIKTPSIWIPFK